MKKLLFQFMFMLLIFPAFSQGYISVSGTVTDIATGNPIPNQAVTILSDSTTGFVYYQMVFTDNAGFYFDTIAVTLGVSGTLFIQTYDCNSLLHEDVWNYTPMQTHTSDFSICYANTGGCQAFFIYNVSDSNMVSFQDMSTGSPAIISWSWNFGDPAAGTNNTSTLQDPVHIYSMPGTYTVCLTIQGSDSTCSDMYCQAVVLGSSGNCDALFTFYADTASSANTIHFVDLSTTGYGHISTWTWSFGDGNTQTIAYPANPNVTHTYLSNGTYTPCLTIQGNDSSCYDHVCATIVIGPDPGCIANFTYSDSTNNGTVQFFDLSQAGGGAPIIAWNWNFGDPASGTNNSSSYRNPVHSFTAPGNYTVCLTIQGADSSCFDEICKTVVVGDTTGCQAYFTYTCTAPTFVTVQFSDLSTGNPTGWLWSFGDGTSSTIQNPAHTFAATGTFNVCLTITGNNCTSTYCQDVVVQDSTNYHQIYGQVFEGDFPLPMGAVMIFSFDTTANYQPYVDVSIIDSNGVYYFTSVPDGSYYILAIPFDSNGYLPTYYGNTINWEQATIVTTTGTLNNPYNINLVASEQMIPGPGSATGQINMGDLSTAMVDKINMILKNDQGKAIGFTKVSTEGAFSFPTMAYGTYYLHPEMPGVTSDNIMIVLTPEKPHADVVLTFTGNKIQGINDITTLVDQWSVYPNPVTDHVSVSLDMKQGTPVVAEIYNMTGQLLSSSTVVLHNGNNIISLSTASLTSGLFTLRIYSKEGVNIHTKLVKTR